MKLHQLAEALGATLVGTNGEVEIKGIATLSEAGSDQLSFLTNPAYAREAAETGAAAVLAKRGKVAPESLLKGASLLEHDAPYLALAKALELFHPNQDMPAGVHKTALIHLGAEVHPSAAIGPYVVIKKGARIGAKARLETGVVIGEGASVDEGAYLGPYCVVAAKCSVGAHCQLEPHCVVGSNGFGYATDKEFKHRRVPQVGSAHLEAYVDLGAHCLVDRGAISTTRVGAGTKMGNHNIIGHNVQVGENCLIVGQVALSGSSSVGDRVTIAGNVGVVGHVHIGDGATVAAKSAVTRSIPAGQTVRGFPARPYKEVSIEMKLVSELPDLFKRLAALEAQLGKPEA
ncbi:MAG: UDP-3-O-(3-hydroxymyristoyl)glucosamine N-acyltransferase [Myxococcota bacterium]|jgi:UDP-3-O-[3-hydroxymyristoyl] glucosamine N-acyltransferase|nr:UDP-3-O-(3-hydroxymyristoyl)glucosamine N-acyltransferase [Myxococcota bacterium]